MTPLDKLDNALSFLRDAPKRDVIVSTYRTDEPNGLAFAIASIVNIARAGGYTRKSNMTISEDKGLMHISVSLGNHP